MLLIWKSAAGCDTKLFSSTSYPHIVFPYCTLMFKPYRYKGLPLDAVLSHFHLRSILTIHFPKMLISISSPVTTGHFWRGLLLTVVYMNDVMKPKIVPWKGGRGNPVHNGQVPPSIASSAKLLPPTPLNTLCRSINELKLKFT